MITREHCVLMAEYNVWMNERLYALCERLDDAERRAERGAFFGSIHATLNHLAFGDLAALSRFTGDPPKVPPLGVDLYPDFAALHAARVALDRRIAAWAATVNAQWLAGTLTYTSVVDGRTRTLPRWALAAQMFNHQTHHRGQITTLLSQMGHDIGATDIPFMERFTVPPAPARGE
jgi:uncharacterized damage-inducible protein DinB